MYAMDKDNICPVIVVVGIVVVIVALHLFHVASCKISCFLFE